VLFVTCEAIAAVRCLSTLHWTRLEVWDSAIDMSCGWTASAADAVRHHSLRRGFYCLNSMHNRCPITLAVKSTITSCGENVFFSALSYLLTCTSAIGTGSPNALHALVSTDLHRVLFVTCEAIAAVRCLSTLHWTRLEVLRLGYRHVVWMISLSYEWVARWTVSLPLSSNTSIGRKLPPTCLFYWLCYMSDTNNRFFSTVFAPLIRAHWAHWC